MQNPRLPPFNAPRTLNVTYARVLVGHVQQVRPELLHLLKAQQLACLAQNDPNDRCTLRDWHALIDAAEALLGTPDLVPELSEQFKPWHAGLMGFTLMTSSTVNELGGLLKRFHHLLNDVFVVDHGVREARFFLRLDAATSEQSHRLARLSFCIWARRLRWLTGQPDMRLDVSFAGPPPADMAPYRRIFGGTVRFDQNDNTLWGDSECAQLPILSQDAASHALLCGQAQKHLEQLSHSADRFIEQLQVVIRTRLDAGKVTLEDVATELHLPPRTLQRRLEESNLNFRLMVDGVRNSQAQHYLSETEMPLVELASAMGFADHASFNRAFKRWTGLSPGAFRRSRATAVI
ncbi:AraC family transcriptional regulator [Aquabacterium sp.]|uniref:AraC family transcriptional regulator n=1 Tax=Aquabacterium sp. TaxID=1872578 RepID=UPI00198EBB8B|nr:AraC family transcriptional regulator [Aquabacterium sp.]MBC7698852.1 AraC family transcriptional regulator ligand-binding domain-containing protein [Aquabacterium sp.]